jgi:DNA-binding response OmpR family regulator
MKQRILLVDEDATSLHRVADGLRFQDFEVVCANNLDQGLEWLGTESFDGVVTELHWSAKNRNGLEICRYLREHQLTTPVIVLSSSPELMEELLSFEAGADDWIPKPSSPTNIGVRVKTRIRRNAPGEVLVAGGFSINLQTFKGWLGEKEIDFTEHEVRFLAVLLEQPGRVFSQKELKRRVWGIRYAGSDNALKSTVKRIRRKIERDPRVPAYLVNIHGEGYRFHPPRSTAQEEQELDFKAPIFSIAGKR